MSMLTALKDLLETEEDKEVAQRTSKSKAVFDSPGSIGTTLQNPISAEPVQRKSEKARIAKAKSQNGVSAPASKNKAIWDEEELDAQEHGDEELSDGLIEPEHEIRFKQAVSPEDMYLGMSGRSPASHSCEEIVVNIKLPGEKMSDVDLDVTKETLKLTSSKFKLFLTLPHPVDDKEGSAKFITQKSLLRVTLPVRRDYQFLLD
eukprot:m.22198 g.22198  ORF g.22198 m.22198 type:complete len:204 (+) comp5431_c0_seq2:92-703(+)